MMTTAPQLQANAMQSILNEPSRVKELTKEQTRQVMVFAFGEEFIEEKEREERAGLIPKSYHGTAAGGSRD